MSDEQDYLDYYDEIESQYADPETIHQLSIFTSLKTLTLFSGNLDLANQAMNLSLVDEFVMNLEYSYLRSKFDETSTPYQPLFLSAQSQMWIFYAYELLRTWRQIATSYVKTARNGGLTLKLKELRKKDEYSNPTIARKKREIEALIASPSLIDDLNRDLEKTHILFTRLEMLRVSLAKHEMRKKPSAHVVTPTVGYMNRECGSLMYQLNSGMIVMGDISRRDIADHIRLIPELEPLTDEEKSSFDEAMKGLSEEDIRKMLDE